MSAHKAFHLFLKCSIFPLFVAKYLSVSKSRKSIDLK